MNKTRGVLLATLGLSYFLSAQAQQIEPINVASMGTKSIEVSGLRHYYIYSISCTSNFALKAKMGNLFSAKQATMHNYLTLHVNPGEVTDKHGKHGAEPVYEFGYPVGNTYFYAQPDATGVIDFSVVNTTHSNYKITCTVNHQNLKVS
jgi:hypothetical protein